MKTLLNQFKILTIPMRMAMKLGVGGIFSKSRRGILATSYAVLLNILRKDHTPTPIQLFYKRIPFTVTLESSADFALLREVFLDEEYAHEYIDDAICIFDVGANVGVASLYFHCIYPRATIYAFEPDPVLYGKLELRVNSIPEIIPMQLALTDIDGEVPFYSFRGSPLSGSLIQREEGVIPQMVQARTISSIVAEKGIQKINMLKFDIEGGEKNLFKNENDRNKAMRLIGEVHLDLMKMRAEEFAGLFPNFSIAATRYTGRKRYIFSAIRKELAL